MATVLFVAVLYGSVRAYVAYEFHRATSMIAEAEQVRIGDPEASVVSLVRRYGGYKWKLLEPADLGREEDWLDKDEYERLRASLNDHAYMLEVNPWGFPIVADLRSEHRGRVDEALRAVTKAIPAEVRRRLGMRDWFAGVELTIRDGHVHSVSALTVVEGRSEWLGHAWTLAEEMPERRLQWRRYAVGTAHMTMTDSQGQMIENYLTPRASEEEAQAAHSANAACLTSAAGCDGACDFSRRAMQYLEQHPEAASNFVPPKCR